MPIRRTPTRRHPRQRAGNLPPRFRSENTIHELRNRGTIMRTSQLIISILFAALLVGSVTAQPMDQSTALLPADEQVTERTSPAYLLYDNLCSTPIDMTGSPTETRTVVAGTCVQIDPQFNCPQCGDGRCWCSVTITGPGGYYNQISWDCHDGQPCDPLCFYLDEGDYTFAVDVCSGENGFVECGSCCK